MYINIDTLAYPLSESQIRSENPNVSFIEPFAPPENYQWVFSTPAPIFDPISQLLRETAPVLTDKGHYEQQWEVLTLPQETIAANQAAKAELDAKTVQQKIEALWAAADKYTSGFISGVAIGILTIGVIQQKPKALAVSAWSQSVWTEYYLRKAQITPTSVDNHDFSSFGPIPHSVPEMQAELGF